VIDRIEIMQADEGWRHAAPLIRSIWSPEVVATLPWRNVTWGTPDWRVLAFDAANTVVGHTGISLREGQWDSRPVRIGGIGGVVTRQDSRGRGVASTVMRRAMQELADTHRRDFGLLFCEPRLAPVYAKLGWQRFSGEVLAMQPSGRVRFDVTDPYVLDLALAPRTGTLDPHGLPW
jgi:aminoglycoside 2'-N-acetyltransferase I